MGEDLPQLPLVDDFQTDTLASGEGGLATIGYLTWSDGSAVAIQTVEVADSNELALPDQSGNNTILQLDTNIASGGWAGFSHAFANETMDAWVSQDWSHYEGIF